VVLLLRMPKRTYTALETFSATAELANFGAQEITGTQPFWKISDERGREITGDELDSLTAPTGKLSPLGRISASLSKVYAPCKLTVTVGLKDTEFSNWWDIWVYPDEAAPQPPADLLVCTNWDDATKSALADGKTVLLLPAKKSLRHSLAGSFLATFWSPVWFPSQKPDTMSILCDPKHRLFAQFPTDFYSDWQWYDLMQYSRPLILDSAPAEFRPLVQVIDNFARNHKLGTVFEARVGKGKLLVCSIDISTDLARRPAARQFAKSLFAYAGSGAFKPKSELDVVALDNIFGPGAFASTLAKLGATILRADSEATGYEAANATDGDPETCWHTAWEPSPKPMPHEIVIDLGKPVALRAVTYLPRQDMANGRIADYEIYAGSDDKNFGNPVAQGRWKNSDKKQIVRFATKVTARYLRIVAKSEVNANAFASAAEFDVELENP
jgi:hypothetical protein